MNSMRLLPAIALGGTALVAVAALLGLRKSTATRTATANAVANGGEIRIRVTGYWPRDARTDKERRTEGGLVDRKSRPLNTVEDFFAGRSDHVSLSGDDAAWPYGQRVDIPWIGGRTIVGRVVDTGSHFRGAGKIYRALGYEPIDVCVETRRSAVPKPPTVVARVVKGDHQDKAGREIATSKFQGQQVVTGLIGLDALCLRRAA